MRILKASLIIILLCSAVAYAQDDSVIAFLSRQIYTLKLQLEQAKQQIIELRQKCGDRCEEPKP